MTTPTSVSLAAMPATWAMSCFPSIVMEVFFNSSTNASTALSIPRLRSIGLLPAATFRKPSRTIAHASTVAVVVPSPAASLVLLATSFTSCAPMFSLGSSSSISLATVTPSLVIVGEPHFFSSTTFRPLGPSVTRTALATFSTPRSSARRASSSYSRIFAGIASPSPQMISPGSYQRPGFSTLHLQLLTLIVKKMRRQIKTLSVLRPPRGSLSILYWGRHDRPPAGAPMAVGPGALPPGPGFVAVLQFRAGRVIRRALELPTVRVRELAVLVMQQEGALGRPGLRSPSPGRQALGG